MIDRDMLTHYYAHSLTGEPPEKWEPLESHLRRVADLAAQFAAKWDAAEWGRLAGLWHDLGKYSIEFQSYLARQNGIEAHIEQASRVDHSTAGAQLASRLFAQAGRILAYCIAGHHAGLADAVATNGASSLTARLQKVIPAYNAPAWLLESTSLPNPRLNVRHGNANRAAFQLALFCRMLFSALVDADFLATEEFMAFERACLRPAGSLGLQALQDALDSHLQQLKTHLGQNEVFTCRQAVLEACRLAADNPPGLFSLTVPTGGGKTLASLAFALRHAQRNGMTRIIYGIPFTTIIEQTADVFRNALRPLGDDVLLEHHSNLDPERETPKSRLASENWDAPLVVTTNVEFFESLFAAKPSRCRKLHRIAGSVVILDEAQTLPLDLLTPCLAILRELASDYGCTIVLCTATQPAIVERPEFPIGLTCVREIMQNPNALYQRMRRVDVTFLGQIADDALLPKLELQAQFLCIVNTRPHAVRLFDALCKRLGDAAGLYHLSTLMCPAHRTQVLNAIRNRLKKKQSCRAISTQLVEAGIDLDFPIVFRALSGIDSIAQAAGRCNREGRQQSGTVFVFEPTDVRLYGMLASMADSGREIAANASDLLDLDTVRRYFELHYWKHSDRWDARHVMGLFQSPEKLMFQYREASERFRLIQEATRSVIVPWDSKGQKLVNRLRLEEADRELRRMLQRYTVNVHEQNYRQMIGSDFEEIRDGCTVLMNMDIYDPNVGLRLDRPGNHEIDSLIF